MRRFSVICVSLVLAMSPVVAWAMPGSWSGGPDLSDTVVNDTVVVNETASANDAIVANETVESNVTIETNGTSETDETVDDGQPVKSELARATEALVADTEALSAIDDDPVAAGKKIVNKALRKVRKTVRKGVAARGDEIEALSKAVSAAENVEDVDTDELESLLAQLKELEETNRRGWHYKPPEGTVTGLDIARAAVDLATSASPQPEYTDPSDMHAAYYVKVHDQVLAGEDYRACSCVTSCAVHWAGADPDFPRNTSAIIHNYCENSPRWQLVGHSPDKEYLQPGDIFTSNYHTYMYVGNEVVRERFPFSDADVYTGGNQLPFCYFDVYTDRGFDVYRYVSS